MPAHKLSGLSRSRASKRKLLSPVAAVALALCHPTLHAEQPLRPSATDLPDAPSTSLVQDTLKGQTTPSTAPEQTKRILGIVPNFRAVSADTKLPPQSTKDKFIVAGHDTFDYSSFLLAAVQAGEAFSGNAYPEFHEGVKGYSRYYWHTLADTIDENFMVGGIGPVLFHQDSRFYTLGHGGFLRRTRYATTRVAVSRSDSGNSMPNFAEVIGAGAAAGLASTYYPTRYQTWTKVGQKWLTSMVIDGANFTVKEFWPDIHKKLTHSHP